MTKKSSRSRRETRKRAQARKRELIEDQFTPQPCSDGLATLQESQHSEDPQKRSVPLHNLCNHCRKVGQDPRLINHIIARRFRSSTRPFTILYKLSTVAELLDEARTCHLCRLILGVCRTKHFFKIPPQSSRARIYIILYELNPELRKPPRFHFDIYMGRPSYVSVHQREPMARLFIKSFTLQDTQSAIKLPPGLGWSSAPLLPRDNIGVLKQWLKECIAQHEKCHAFQIRSTAYDTQRPTRLLDLSNEEVRLCCDMETRKSTEYLTLSHMWGQDPSQQLRLVTKKVATFQKGIPSKAMPHTYGEAIRITRFLGYRYLWIDSLCIIQDSEEDWKAEAVKMASVYGNSVCTLSHLLPPQFEYPPDVEPDTRRGDPRGWIPCILSSPTDGNTGIYAYRSAWDSKRMFQLNWPLFDRGWVFQERLLSPRNLYFGHEALMWECQEAFCEELVGEKVSRSDGTKLGIGNFNVNIRNFLLNDLSPQPGCLPPGIRQVISVWENIIEDYRRKRFTKATDRAIGFSGVARAYYHLCRGTYLAGLWRELLHFNLLWYIQAGMACPISRDALFKQYESTHAHSQEDPILNAPSWSWFSISVHQHLSWMILINYINIEAVVFISLAEIISTTWKSETSNWTMALSDTLSSAYADFSGLQITLKCLTLTAQLSPLEEGIFKFCSPSSRNTSLGYQFGYYHDDVEVGAHVRYSDRSMRNGYHEPNGKGPEFNAKSTPPANVILANITEYTTNDSYGSYVYQEAYGLVLTQSLEDEGAWKRVGVWSLRVHIDGIEGVNDADRIPLFHNFEGWREEYLTIV